MDRPATTYRPRPVRRTWPEEMLLLAEAMWRDGFTASEIGAHVGKTRNAICGQASREGWKVDPEALTRKKARWAARSSENLRQFARPAIRGHKPETAPSARVVLPPPLLPPPLPIAAVALVLAPRIPDPREVAPRLLIDLRACQCRWPVSDAPKGHGETILFCAADTGALGISYCPAHRRVAHQRRAA